MLADLLPKIAAQFQEARDPYRPRPSMAGPERCIRQLVYSARGESASPLPGRALMVFDDSSWHEELTADWIRKTAYQLHSMQMVVETPVGYGKIDGILTDLLGVDRLWEHKALNHFTFERIWNGQWPLDYVTQCALYLTGVRLSNPDILECLLLVKNKNTAQYLEMLLSYNQASDEVTLLKVVRSDGKSQSPGLVWVGFVTHAVEKFAEVERHRAAGTLPRRPFEYGTTFPCGYCPYEKPCWEGYEDEFTNLAADQELDQDLVTMAAYACETRGHLKSMEQEYDEIKGKIKAELDQRGIRHGKTSEYAITLSMREKTSWDESAMPADVVNRAKRKTPYIQLDVRKLKLKEAVKNGNGT